jgi:hypothetical protein
LGVVTLLGLGAPPTPVRRLQFVEFVLALELDQVF